MQNFIAIRDLRKENVHDQDSSYIFGTRTLYTLMTIWKDRVTNTEKT